MGLVTVPYRVFPQSPGKRLAGWLRGFLFSSFHSLGTSAPHGPLTVLRPVPEILPADKKLSW